MSRPEILAPAGNREMLGAAVFSGADAVYLGLTGFNARRTAGNFTPEELQEAVSFCHARGVKVHVTLNTLVYDRELAGLADAVRAVAAAGADAVIADDLAAAQLVKSIAPTLPNRRLTSTTRTSESAAASFQPKRKSANITAIFARPIFTPGMPTDGSSDSTYERIIATAVSMARRTSRFVFFISTHQINIG